jgi:hypothetical protein
MITIDDHRATARRIARDRQLGVFINGLAYAANSPTGTPAGRHTQ